MGVCDKRDKTSGPASSPSARRRNQWCPAARHQMAREMSANIRRQSLPCLCGQTLGRRYSVVSDEWNLTMQAMDVDVDPEHSHSDALRHVSLTATLHRIANVRNVHQPFLGFNPRHGGGRVGKAFGVGTYFAANVSDQMGSVLLTSFAPAIHLVLRGQCDDECLPAGCLLRRHWGTL